MKWIVQEPSNEPIGCVLALPGRGLPADMMEKFLSHCGLWRSLSVVLEPEYLEWYPQPNGAADQSETVAGLKTSCVLLNHYIRKIEKCWEIPRSQIGIVGFSAGGVMALQMAIHSKLPFAGIACLAGAIFEPDKVIPARHQTPILLKHNYDDSCFEWEERYLPMKKALVAKGYNISVEEGAGEHNLTYDDVRSTRQFLSKQFGYYDDYEEVEGDEE